MSESGQNEGRGQGGLSPRVQGNQDRPSPVGKRHVAGERHCQARRAGAGASPPVVSPLDGLQSRFEQSSALQPASSVQAREAPFHGDASPFDPFAKAAEVQEPRPHGALPPPVISPATDPRVGQSMEIEHGDQAEAYRDAAAELGQNTPEAIAARGLQGPGGALPHLAKIQAAFGKHSLSGVQSFKSGPAQRAAAELGAEAYAFEGKIGFGTSPSLHTAAHEAAHVVQHRRGVFCKGGIGAADGALEAHADAVADAVVRGESAEDVLDQMPSGRGGRGGVQLKPKESRRIRRLRRTMDTVGQILERLEVPPDSVGADGPSVGEAPGGGYRDLGEPGGVHPMGDAAQVLADMPAMAAPPLRDRGPQQRVGGGEAPDIKPSTEPSGLLGDLQGFVQASLSLEDARRVQGEVCAEHTAGAEHIESTTAAFLDLLCATSEAGGKAPAPRRFNPEVAPDALRSVQASLEEIAVEQTAVHAREHANPDFLHPHPHRRGGPRAKIYGPLVKVLGQRERLKAANKKLAAGFTQLNAEVATLRQSVGAANEAHAGAEEALESKGGRAAKKAAEKRTARALRRLLKTLKAKEAKLERAAKAIEKNDAALAAATEKIEPLATRARKVLLAELRARIEQLEALKTAHAKAEAACAALDKELTTLRAQLAGTKGRSARRRLAKAIRKTVGELKAAEKRLGDRAKRLRKREKWGDLETLQGLQDRAEAGEPMVQTIEQTDYQGTIEGEDYDLTTPRPGHLALDRPEGFQVGGRERVPRKTTHDAVATGLGIEDTETGEMSDEDRERLDIGIRTTEAISRSEGNADSINTWDNVVLTLGAGLTGSGRLQQAFWRLRAEAPADFQALFGKFGVDIHKEGRGDPFLSVVDTASGRRLSGKAARQHIANDPKLLIACRHAGKNKAWQRALAYAKVGHAIVAGVDFRFTVSVPAIGRTPAQKRTFRLFDVLEDAGDHRGAALAAIADHAHKSGNVGQFKKAVPGWFLEVWMGQEHRELANMARSGIPILSRDAQVALARRVFLAIERRRRGPIAEKFGVPRE